MIKALSVSKIPKLRSMLESALKDVASEAYIFGSLAFGYAIQEESDADLLIVPKRKLGLDEIYDILDRTFEYLLSKGIVLHVVIYEDGMKSLLEEARKGVKII